MEDIAVSNKTRIIGGALGIVAAAVVVPAYIVGSPEAPATPADAAEYYEEASSFVLLNGIVPIAHVVAFLLFLAVLLAVVGNAFISRAAVLGGGVAMVTLTAAGFAAEIVYPATAARFTDVELGDGLPVLTLTLAVWLYHFAQAAGAVMMIGVAVASIAGRVFPAWFGWLSVAFGILALLHTWLGVWSAWASLVWLVLVSLMLMVPRRQPIPQ